MIDHGFDWKSVGILNRPIFIKEDNDEVVKGIAREGRADREVVRLTPLDVASGDSNPAAALVSKVECRITSDIRGSQTVCRPGTSSRVSVGGHQD